MNHFSRRGVMLGLGATGLLAGRARSQPIFAGYPFQLGVAAGEPAPDGFVIWTRLAPLPLEPGHGMPARTVPVAWEVAADAGFRTIVHKGEALARPELAHAVHVEVAGLEPGRPYWYRFNAGGEQSLTGRAKTAPAKGADVQRVRLGVCGCQNYQHGFYTAHRKLAGEDVDFVFCYGDYIYEGRGERVWNSPVGPVENPRQVLGEDCFSLDDYRRRYAQYKMDADLQASHAAAAWFCVWDDHEVANDWTGEHDRRGTPPELFALRRQAAAQAYYEHMPLRPAALPRGPAIQIYRRADYGRLLSLHLMDTRQFRSPQPCNDRWIACSELDRPDAEVMGQAQERWLQEGLSGPARWKALGQQVMLMDLDREPGPDYVVNSDTWAGYRAPRERLLRFIRDRKIDNAIVLTGDEHQHFAGELQVDGRRPEPRPVAVEFVGTSISSNGDGEDLRPQYARIKAANPQLKFVNSQRGYLVCDVTPERWLTEFKVLDRITTRGGTLSTRMKLAVEAGQPKLVEA